MKKKAPKLAARLFLKSIGEEATDERVDWILSVMKGETPDQPDWDKLAREKAQAAQDRKEAEKLKKQAEKIKADTIRFSSDSSALEEVDLSSLKNEIPAVKPNDSGVVNYLSQEEDYEPDAFAYCYAFNNDSKHYDLYKIGLNSLLNKCKIVEVKRKITDYAPRASLELSKVVQREVIDYEKRRRK